MPDNNRKTRIRKQHVSFKEREYLTENLALSLKAAVPVSQALASLEETTASRPLKKSLSNMQVDIEAGVSLSETLEKSGVMSEQTLALVKLGEQSGHLAENMQVAAEQEEKRHAFHAKIRSAMIYPSFVLGLTVVVGLGVAWFLLPRLAVTFSQLNVQLPSITKLMIGLGIFLREHGLIAVPIFFAVVIFLIWVLFAAPRTKVIGQRLLFKTPGIARLLREVEIAQFGYLLGTLLDAGLPITKAIRLLAASSTALEYRNFYYYLADSLENGQSFKESLESNKKVGKLFPGAVRQMIIAGERSGSLPEVLRTIGRTYERKADTTTQNLEAVIEPVLLVIVWVGVMVLAISVVVPIYSLVGGLNK